MRQRLLFAIATIGTPLIGAFLACGAPDSFEHLVGKPLSSEAGADVVIGPPVGDGTLKAPRPVAPLSGSYIDSLRPHFRWQLAPDTIGANVDVCDKPDCSGVKKTYTATGTELKLGEDLPIGRWFWRISSTTTTSFGTTPSPTWLLLVRGGAANGDARGTVVDLNGDGNADLIATSIGPPEPEFTGNTIVAVLGNDPNDATSFALDPMNYEGSTLYETSTTPTYAVADVNGDGLTDVFMADTLKSSTSPSTAIVQLIPGSSLRLDYGLAENPIGDAPVPPLDVQPTIASGGDLDGDGYADMIVSQRTYAFALYGSPTGLSLATFFDDIDPNPPPDAGELPPPPNPLAVFGVDQNTDGFTDVAESSSYIYTPLYILTGAADHTVTDTEITITSTPTADRALLFAAGDIDADGKPDIGFTTALVGKPSVCVLLGSVDTKNGTIACFTPTTPGTGFGSSIVAADIDGDGKDEFLVGTTAGGVDVLTMPTPNTLAAEHLTLDYGAGLTVLFPGRPGPAVWAATRQDGATVAIYRGKDQARVLNPPPGFTSFAPAIR